MEEINVEVAFARKTLSSPNSSLKLALSFESNPALTLAIPDTNQFNFHLPYSQSSRDTLI
jgi:hypothetical protein